MRLPPRLLGALLPSTPLSAGSPIRRWSLDRGSSATYQRSCGFDPRIKVRSTVVMTAVPPAFCGQALVRHPDEGVHLAKFPGKLAPGIARIGAAEDLTVDATGQQKIGVGSVRGQVPDRAVGG